MAAHIKHQKLGQIQGKQGDGIVQFLGIKYASLKDRFAGSELVEYGSGESVIDATNLGPTVINPPMGIENEFGFIQKSLPVPKLTSSDVEGLNLNINVPLVESKLPTPDSKLPVFAFVHGGGFSVGSNAWPQNNLANIVKLSADIGLPVIGVGINYRLGAAGFLTSEELRKAGYPSNNGLRDQINAFRWVQKYISDFGGDPKNVTFIGESAGSVAGNLLLHSREPLFKRYISMSGTTLTLQPIPPFLPEVVYSSVIKSLDAEGLSSEERIKKLLDLSNHELATLVPPGLPLLPVVDNDLIPGNLNFTQVSSKENPSISQPGRNWCEELLIGDCQFDASIYEFMLGPRVAGVAKTFCDSINKTLGDKGKKVLEAYEITPDLSDKEGLYKVLKFSTDISFFAPIIALAQGWPGKAYVYHFNEPNPWDGKWKGEASHVLDVAYLFQNFNEFLDEAQRQVAVQFAGDFIKFMDGKTEWPTFGTKEGAQVYGPSGKGFTSEYVEGVTAENSGRRAAIYDLADDISLDALAGAWSAFFTGAG